MKRVLFGRRVVATGSPACLIGLLGLTTMVAPSVALAQSADFFDRSDAVGVLQRPRPDYAALGIDAGAFKINPSLTIAPEYDDNIFAATTSPTSDLVTAIQPAIQARSDWSRNELDASAQLTSDLYANNPKQNTTDYQVAASGRLDILTQSNVATSFAFGRYTEPRTAEDSLSVGVYPVQYDLSTFNIVGLQTLSRFRFSEQFNFQSYSYSNTTDTTGAVVLENYLNDKQYTLSGTTSYAFDPKLALFASAQLNDRPYDERPPQTALDRSSDGFQVTAGANFDLTHLLSGRIELGYLSQYYNSSAFHTVNGPVFQANVQYFLSELTTMTFTGDRRVIDATDPAAISILQTQGGLRVDHELLRNVILSGIAAYETDSFKGEQRTDDRASLSLSATYLLNRHLGLTAEYSLLNEDSSGSAGIGNYVVNVLSLSVVFQL